MFTERTAAPFASHAEARAIVERAKALRAQTLGRILRAGWGRIALPGKRRMSARA